MPCICCLNLSSVKEGSSYHHIPLQISTSISYRDRLGFPIRIFSIHSCSEWLKLSTTLTILSSDYRSSYHVHPRSGAAGLPSGGRRGDERESSHRELVSSRAAVPPEPQHLGLCHVHLREQQFKELQTHAGAELDINENFISQESPRRPRTKSDTTQQNTTEIPVVVESSANENDLHRIRVQTAGQSQKNSRFFCDSCKARHKADNLSVAVNSSGKRCSGSCASRDAGAVDLTALPPPGNEEEDEVEIGVGKLQPPTPAIAAPPPGFRDNSSDEDDSKRGRKARINTSQTVASGKFVQTKEDVPVTLIDNVSTRTVRDHAQELDDALVSTLQALEALAASEDFPHHSQQSTQTAGQQPQSYHSPHTFLQTKSTTIKILSSLLFM